MLYPAFHSIISFCNFVPLFHLWQLFNVSVNSNWFDCKEDEFVCPFSTCMLLRSRCRQNVTHPKLNSKTFARIKQIGTHFWYKWMDSAQCAGCSGVEFINFKPKVHEILNFEYFIIKNSIRLTDSNCWTAQITQPRPDYILR